MQVVLTNSDQLGLPLLYTYENKFPLQSLNSGEMEEVSANLFTFSEMRYTEFEGDVHYFRSYISHDHPILSYGPFITTPG